MQNLQGPMLWLCRILMLAVAVTAGIFGFWLFLQFGAADGIDAFDILRASLILLSSFWLALGALGAVFGLLSRAPKPPRKAGPLHAKTVILLPVYGEDPRETFARLAAMETSLDATGEAEHFHFAVLSDTRDEAKATAEWQWFERLVSERAGKGRYFYRRRQNNTGKKAGNIEEFIKSSGAAYDYAVILDADSLMEGETLVEMVRRMEAAPKLGLLQTLPHILSARSRFGRGMAFAAAFHSPVFARGQAALQGQTGPFWGHNAIVRVTAFAQSCGLPELSGRPPFGGPILSHDYVEAALLARAGWHVRLDDDLLGSYEEGPENIVDHAKRDRRWAQGNLQHSRLLATPGLKLWNRFTLLQGILAYIAPLFWLAFILASILAPLTAPEGPNYFPNDFWSFPVFPADQTDKAISLALGVFGLLILPKALVWLHAILTRRTQGFGGALRAGGSVLAELFVSSLMAPLFLMFQTRSVLQILLGRDGGWPPNNRGDGQMSLKESYTASRWIMMYGALGLCAAFWLSPALVPWLLPVALPMIGAPLIISLTSRPTRSRLYQTPQDKMLPAIAAAHLAQMEAWND